MTSKIALSVARPRDRLAIERVLRSSYAHLLNNAYEQELLARIMPFITRANPQLLRSRTYYVAEVNGDVVGCGGWSPEKPGSSDYTPGIAHLRHFATAAAWSGCGIGRRIYERCEQDALAAGFDTFECYSTLNAEQFYSALGFVRIGRLRVPIGNGLSLPSIHMARRI